MSGRPDYRDHRRLFGILADEGFGFTPEDFSRLAELIALGRTDEALDALYDIAPELAPRPATIKTVLAARAAEPPHRFNP